MQNIIFWTPSQHWIWSIVMWEEASIAIWIYHNLPGMYSNDYRGSRLYLQNHYTHNNVIPWENWSKFSWNISDFRCPLGTGYWIQCYKEAHPLLIDYFITFLLYIEMIIWVSDSIYDCLYGPYCVISAENNSQILCKITVGVGTLFTLKTGYCATRRDIHC